jgi:hypothetical protein
MFYANEPVYFNRKVYPVGSDIPAERHQIQSLIASGIVAYREDPDEVVDEGNSVEATEPEAPQSEATDSSEAEPAAEEQAVPEKKPTRKRPTKSTKQ